MRAILIATALLALTSCGTNRAEITMAREACDQGQTSACIDYEHLEYPQRHGGPSVTKCHATAVGVTCNNF